MALTPEEQAAIADQIDQIRQEIRDFAAEIRRDNEANAHQKRWYEYTAPTPPAD